MYRGVTGMRLLTASASELLKVLLDLKEQVDHHPRLQVLMQQPASTMIPHLNMVIIVQNYHKFDNFIIVNLKNMNKHVMILQVMLLIYYENKVVHDLFHHEKLIEW